jgi:hypothetical protein
MYSVYLAGRGVYNPSPNERVHLLLYPVARSCCAIALMTLSESCLRVCVFLCAQGGRERVHGGCSCETLPWRIGVPNVWDNQGHTGPAESTLGGWYYLPGRVVAMTSDSSAVARVGQGVAWGAAIGGFT